MPGKRARPVRREAKRKRTSRLAPRRLADPTVGTAVSVVAIIGPVSTDPTVLKQMGGTLLSHLSDVQVGRLKSAQGMTP
jgi:hypothetical protein